jgi:chromosome segregation ATPase
MKREFLKDLELSDEVVDKIMAENGKDINNLKGQMTSLTQERDGLKGQVSDRDNQIKELGEQAGNSQKLQDQIAGLQQKIKTNDETAASNLLKVKQDNAIQNFLKDAGVRDVRAITPFIDDDIVKYDADKNELAGLSEQVEKLKTDHDYLFEPQDGGKPGVNVTIKGNPNGTTETKTDEFAKALGLHNVKGD